MKKLAAKLRNIDEDGKQPCGKKKERKEISPQEKVLKRVIARKVLLVETVISCHRLLKALIRIS